MFKRSTKITSLLVAAASIATMVPAMAADVKKLDDQDGTIYNAIAYKDGQFYIDGDLEDKDEAAYYLSDGKYTDLDDIDSGDEVRSYGTKYVEVGSEGDGDYYLDLSTGKVTDDDVAKDAEDDAISALRKKVKKDGPEDRYDKGEYEDLVKASDFDLVKSAAFQDEYYETSYKKSDKVTDKVNGGADKFHVYTDKDGNYIDADYNVGKISIATSGTTGDGVKVIENTNDDKEGYRAVITHKDTIAQDKDYVYRTAYLKITDADGTVDVTKDMYFGGSKNSNKVNVTTDAGILVIQKISKAQASDDIDDAKYAKTVNTYFVTGDAAGNVKAGDLYDKFTVVDGKLVSYEIANNKIYARTIELKSKNGYYYTDIKDSADTDIEHTGSSADYDNAAYSIDADGNLWIVDSGNIKKWDNDEDFDKVYKVDGSVSQLSVYDKDNLIAWDEDDEVYAMVAGKSTEEDNTTGDEVTTTGWAQDATTGAWSYVKADGTKAIGWFQSPTSQLWYYMDANGVMQANGWIQDGGSWYFLDSTGAMKTGWVYTGGAWYFLKPTNGNKGAMQTGWIQTGGKWYYCNASGAMLSNTTVGGYVLGADGAWIK
ncbi:MAG: N-acetylmuramoyl-L-alanine amidase family protein [Clostridium neonatale]